MRFLFVSSHFPYPEVTHGGGTDLFHLIEALSQRHDVDLIASLRLAERPYAHRMDHYCRRVVTIVPTVGWKDRARSAARQALARPWRIGQRTRWLIGQAVSDAVARERYDVVQCVFTTMGRHLPRVQGRAVGVLDEVDVSFLPLYARYQQATGRWARYQALRRYQRGLAAELSYCRAADQVLVRSQRDLEALRGKLPGVPAALLKPWTHLDDFLSIAPERPLEPVILFVGAMQRTENVASALHFYEACWPAVRARVPGARLVIAGADPPESVTRLVDTDRAVTVTGRVPSLRPHYEAARVCIAPILHEGGVMNKVIDGLAAHRPVVTTSAGNAGVGATPGEHLLVADDTPAFADAVIAALTSPDLWQRLGAAGRRYAAHTFGWQQTVASYEALMASLVERRVSLRRAS